MEVKVEVVSTEIIKPASPTPWELRKLKLSLLDQLAPDCYVPIIYFYPSTQLQNSIVDHSQISSQLKSSLSLILSHFYPLAGTIVDGCSFDCDDEGVEYSTARVSCTLSEMVDEPQQNLLLRLLSIKPNYSDEPSCDSRKFNLRIRYNIFSCGGIAIGVSIFHRLFDGHSATHFVKEWAAVCCGVTAVVRPSFDGAELFRPTDVLSGGSPEKDAENVVTKRFVFSEATIAALREQVADSSDEPPTRVEAISAFIWKRLAAIVSEQKQKVEALQAVSLRGRMDPPLSEHSMGNIYWYTVASTAIEEEESYAFFVKRMRKAIKGIDSERVKELQNMEKTLEFMKNISRALMSGEIRFCLFSSWCRFPLYEADFGWGKPSWVFSPLAIYKNMVILTPTSGGDGVEAWIAFEQEVMASFERDIEVLAFTT